VTVLSSTEEKRGWSMMTMLTVEVSTPLALMDALQSPSSRIRGEGARDFVVQRDSDFTISTYQFCACCFGSLAHRNRVM